MSRPNAQSGMAAAGGGAVALGGIDDPSAGGEGGTGQRPQLRRSRRVAAAQALLRRSSSLGEELTDVRRYYRDDSTWRRRKRLRLSAINGNADGSSSVESSSSSDASATTAAAAAAESPSDSPLFSIGVLADIQYAPIPDGHSYGGVPRYYRHALDAARHAAEHFQRESVDLVVNLGDIVDGKCQDAEGHGGEPPTEGDPGHRAVDDVVSALSAYRRGPILHTYGNHELYNLDREEIGRKLSIPFVREPCGDLVGYRTHAVGDGAHAVRFVVLDTYDIATMKRCPTTSRKRKEAERLLSVHNPNFPRLENSPEGMNGMKKRYVAFNGGVDEPQLEWLRSTLQQAKENGEKVVVLSHQPLLPGSSSPVCLVWNYNDVLRILREYSCTVIASFAGHAHRGGYKRDDKSGIHFRVFEAVLESNHPTKTYAFVDVHEDKLVVRGSGDCESAVYDFEHMYERAMNNER